MARWLAPLIALALLGAAHGDAAAQTTPPVPGVIIVDKERVLRESAVAKRLAGREKAARAALQQELDRLGEEIELEEAEISALREEVSKDVFDQRVRAFNDKVQLARRTSQQRIDAIQRQFVQARQQVAETLPSVLVQLMEAQSAAVVIDSRSVLVARQGADLTLEALKRFDEATASLYPDQ